MKPFIRAAEVWLPSPDGTVLDFGAGFFGDAKKFAETSREMGFGRAEGLPGEAWDTGHPILLKTLDDSHFKRSGVAREAGLTCAVALPFFVGSDLTAVLVLLGSDGGAAGHCKGAIELWRNDPRISSDMTLADGYYGGVPTAFEALSRDTYLPRGTGLPGLAWQRDEVVMMSELGPSTRFLRGEEAVDAGIRRGMAFPCCTRDQVSHVLTLLSGDETPLTRRSERWLVDLPGERLQRAGGYCETEGKLDSEPDKVDFSAWREGIATTLLAGRPVLLIEPSANDGGMGEAARACGADAVVCIPVLVEDKVTEVAVLYL